MRHVLYSLALAALSLTSLYAADRNENEQSVELEARAEALKQSIEAVEAKQERVLSRVEAEMQAAKASSATGAEAAEIAAVQSELAARLGSYVESLKAELQFLEGPAPAFYGRLKTLSEQMEARKHDGRLTKAMDRIVEMLPEVKRKADEHRHLSHQLQEHVDSLGKGMKHFENKVSADKHKENLEMAKVWFKEPEVAENGKDLSIDVKSALSKEEVQVLQKKTDADMALITEGKFKPVPVMNTGSNPYGEGHEEAAARFKSTKWWEEEEEAMAHKGQGPHTIHVGDGSLLQVGGEEKKAASTDSQGLKVHHDTVVEVKAHALRHHGNSSHAEH